MGSPASPSTVSNITFASRDGCVPIPWRRQSGRWRSKCSKACGVTGSGLAFDLEFVATMNPHEEGEHFRRRNGRVTEHMARAQQLGAYRGWIEAAGRRLEVSEASWLGQRDHSWGIRA